MLPGGVPVFSPLLISFRVLPETARSVDERG